jgi:hypothetical protein
VAEDFFTALDAFARQTESRRQAPAVQRVLIYGGETAQQRSGVRVVPWSEVDAYDWCGAVPD